MTIQDLWQVASGVGLGGVIVYWMKRIIEKRAEHERLNRANVYADTMVKAQSANIDAKFLCEQYGLPVPKDASGAEAEAEVIDWEFLERNRRILLFTIVLYYATDVVKTMSSADVIRDKSDGVDKFVTASRRVADNARERFGELWKVVDENWVPEIIDATGRSEAYKKACSEFFESCFKHYLTPDDDTANEMIDRLNEMNACYAMD